MAAWQRQPRDARSLLPNLNYRTRRHRQPGVLPPEPPPRSPRSASTSENSHESSVSPYKQIARISSDLKFRPEVPSSRRASALWCSARSNSNEELQSLESCALRWRRSQAEPSRERWCICIGSLARTMRWKRVGGGINAEPGADNVT